MSHDDFTSGYQSGRSWCSVSIILTFRLLFSGRIRQRKMVASLVGWSVGLLVLVGFFIFGFCYLPLLWAALVNLITLSVFAFASSHQIAGVVVSEALADKQFYDSAVAERALRVSTDGETDLSKVQKTVPMRGTRRAQR
ncbi:MAG: hypothetical protein JO333_10685 [Verrucomicrobia bacterium]|nr:hypothetical protein [Verrucomicrobiota bacterium]